MVFMNCETVSRKIKNNSLPYKFKSHENNLSKESYFLDK